MKIIKKVLIILAVIIAIPIVVALFVKKEFHVERQISINKPNELVFDFVKHLKNQDLFSKWNTMDPNMEKSYKGVDATVGFTASWDSENPDVGKGEQEILKIDEGKRIEFELRFLEPMKTKNKAYMTTSSISEQATIVKWGFDGKMNYPMNLMMVLIDFDEMLGSDLQIGLDKLKTILEMQTNDQ